jgi:hypothetical protein
VNCRACLNTGGHWRHHTDHHGHTRHFTYCPDACPAAAARWLLNTFTHQPDPPAWDPERLARARAWRQATEHGIAS